MGGFSRVFSALRFSFLPWTFISGLFACYRSRAGSLLIFYYAVLLLFPERPPFPAVSKYEKSTCFSVGELGFLFFEFWDTVLSVGELGFSVL